MLNSANQRDKMAQEMQIHKTLNHPNIAQFLGNFSTQQFIVVKVEICNRQSLMELSKRRQRLLEPEVRFYSKQIVAALKYLHGKHIIHRDLKLANILLDARLQ